MRPFYIKKAFTKQCKNILIENTETVTNVEEKNNTESLLEAQPSTSKIEETRENKIEGGSKGENVDESLLTKEIIGKEI